MSIAALIGAVLTIIGQLLAEYFKGAPERKRKADALAKIELDDTRDAMADVDRQLDGVQPPRQQ